MRRYWLLALAVAAAAALAVPLTAFAAGGVETTTNGTNVNPGDSLSGSLNGVNAKFVNAGNSNQVVTCTSSSLAATDTTNPTAPGTATEGNSAQTFGGCSISGVFGATGIQSITTDASTTCPWIVSVNDNNEVSPATVTISQATASGCTAGITATVVVQTIFGNQTCNYAPANGTIVGSAVEGSSTAGLAFSNDVFNKTSGPGTCFSSVDFDANYLITDGGAGVIVT